MSTGLAGNSSAPLEPIREDGAEAERASPCAVSLESVKAASLLDSVLETVGRTEEPSASADEAGRRLQRFLAEPSWQRSLLLWFGERLPRSREAAIRSLSRDIALIDDLLNDQINAVLHHPDFQRLEASWRGLKYLVDSVDVEANVKIRVLSVSWRELTRDIERAIEFDQSQLFRKVYSEEFGVAGGEPFGLLVGDYEIHPAPTPDHPYDDIGTLRGIAQVAAAAFAPFIAAAHPSMLGLDDFAELERPPNLDRVFQQKQFLPWNRFREAEEDSRYVGLTLPRVLWRTPYDDLASNDCGGVSAGGFPFREDVSGPGRNKYLWGNAAYAFAAVVVRSFQETGWLADIRGVRRDVIGGGLVTGLAVHSFETDRRGIATKSSTDVIITDMLEKSLGDYGFIPLCPCKDAPYSAFYGNSSVQKPKTFDRLAASVNARISAMLQYTLCVSRFAHYLKVIARDRIGSFGEAQEIERHLQEWLAKYVTVDDDASPQVKCRFPLREAKVTVREIPGQAGKYECIMHLRPHYELEDLTMAVRLRSELAPA
ncbi:MAG: type VI secretion system contractile sheath large subunit [Planctomycetes bacterium]|nr:type VI secretion system contractile sheath large subunit [Planctomycetota bacterium]